MTIKEFKNLFQKHFKEIYFIWEEKYLNDIEDVKWNGNFWTVKYTKKNKQKIEVQDLNNTREKISNLTKYLELKVSINKRRTQATFMDLDSKLNIRLEFITGEGNDWGCVLALRFNTVNKIYNLYDSKISEILKNIIIKRSNLFIGGATGSGKTALQKLIISLISDAESIFLLEDTQDTSLKMLYPYKDITAINIRDNPKYYEDDLLHGFKSAKRFNPEWIILSEATDKILKKYLVETMMSAHKTITTIHNNDIHSTIIDLANSITTSNDNINDVAYKVARNIGYFVSCKYFVSEKGSYVRYIDHISTVEIDLINHQYTEKKLYQAQFQEIQNNYYLLTDKNSFYYINNKWELKNEKN